MMDHTELMKVRHRIDCGRCGECSLQIRNPAWKAFLKTYETTEKAEAHIAYMVGWRHIEINGGETTDEFICNKCQEELYGKNEAKDD